MPAFHEPPEPWSPTRGAEHQCMYSAACQSTLISQHKKTRTEHRPVYVRDDVKWPEFIFHIKFLFKSALYFKFLWWRKQTFAFQSSSNKINEKQARYGFGEYAGKQVRDEKNLFMVCRRVPGYVQDLTHGIGQSPRRLPRCSARSPSAAKQHTGRRGGEEEWALSFRGLLSG